VQGGTDQRATAFDRLISGVVSGLISTPLSGLAGEDLRARPPLRSGGAPKSGCARYAARHLTRFMLASP